MISYLTTILLALLGGFFIQRFFFTALCWTATLWLYNTIELVFTWQEFSTHIILGIVLILGSSQLSKRLLPETYFIDYKGYPDLTIGTILVLVIYNVIIWGFELWATFPYSEWVSCAVVCVVFIAYWAWVKNIHVCICHEKREFGDQAIVVLRHLFMLLCIAQAGWCFVWARDHFNVLQWLTDFMAVCCIALVLSLYCIITASVATYRYKGEKKDKKKRKKKSKKSRDDDYE